MSAKVLTANQARAAHALRVSRPPVIPGTNAITDTAARNTWYAEVKRVMTEQKVPYALTSAFCDIAGVPS